MKKFGDILLVIGAAVLFFIPLIHFIRFGGVKSSADPILWLFASICVLFIGIRARLDNEQSVRSFGLKIVDCYKVMAILTLNAVVLFAALEFASNGFFKAQKLFLEPAAQRVADAREKSSYYADKDWAAQFWDEFALSREQRYYPYAIWRRAPFAGSTININQDGIRLTPGADCNANSFKVFVFGDSTVWGTGVPDWSTIPSYLQARLKELIKGPICVVNFGESAYVSTQSVIALMLQLQTGNVPDLAIFYEGTNDIYAAYQSGRSGVHQNVDQVAAKYKGINPNSGSLEELLKSTHLFALSNSLVGTLSHERQTSPKLITHESMGISAASLSNSIIQAYLSNYRTVDGLAQEYGFPYLFFWPPCVSIGEKPLTKEEKAIKFNVDPALNKLYHLVYPRIEPLTLKNKNLSYMGKIFDDYEPLLWLDATHVTPEGNEFIAKKMLEIIVARGILNKVVNKSPQQASRAPGGEIHFRPTVSKAD